MHQKASNRFGALMIVLASISWSFAGMLGKWAPWGAFSLIGGRAIIAVSVFAIVRKRLTVKSSLGTWLGALGVMSTSALFIMANKMTTAANAIVLQYAMPIVVLLSCFVFFHQRPTRLDLSAMTLTLFGVVLCFMGGLKRGSLVGDILALMSAFTFALVFFAARMPNTNPLDYVYLGNLLSCLLLFAIPFDPSFTLKPQALLVVLAMGLCLAFGYLFFSKGMNSGVNPVVASIVANVEPVLNPFWTFLAVGENPGLFTLLGAALVLCSVTGYSLLKNRREKGREHSTQEA